jgi:hypothetical protein
MVRRYIPLWFALAVCAFLLWQMPAVPKTEAAKTIPAAAPNSPDVVETQQIAPGGRTMMFINTTGLVEVVIFEESEEAQLVEFKAGKIPRTAKVFTTRQSTHVDI